MTKPSSFSSITVLSLRSSNAWPLKANVGETNDRIAPAEYGTTDREVCQAKTLSQCEDSNDKRSSTELNLRPKGILVVEDNALLRRSLGEGFRNRGFDLWSAANGAEAIELYEQFWPLIDIVLSDVQMPVLNGPRMLEILRALNPSLRLCFMTGDTRSTSSAQLLKQGAKRVFEKPLASVEAVAEELWHLAEYPYQVVGNPLNADEESLEPGHAPFEIHGQNGLREFRIVARIRSSLHATKARVRSVFRRQDF